MSHLDNITYILLADAVTPKEGHCYVDRYWVVHPVKGVAFYTPDRKTMAPQCNDIEEIAYSIRNKLYPGHDVMKLNAVFTGRHWE